MESQISPLYGHTVPMHKSVKREAPAKQIIINCGRSLLIGPSGKSSFANYGWGK
jgi:hypothetical protein